MKLKKFNDFEKINEGIDIEKFRPMSMWLDEIHEIINNNLTEEQYGDFITKIEDEYGEDIANIVDGEFSEDKLHYYYSDVLGGVSTKEFVDGFDIYKPEINSMLEEY